MIRPTRKVHVVSRVSWRGADQVAGGFDWWLEGREDAALRGFEAAKKVAHGEVARVRLVTVELPHEFTEEDEVTAWIDADIDMVESRLPARKVALIGAVA
jgi:hypothetical protein